MDPHGWLIDCLDKLSCNVSIDWLIDWLGGVSMGSSIDWLIDWFSHKSMAPAVGVRQFFDWLIDWFSRNHVSFQEAKSAFHSHTIGSCPGSDENPIRRHYRDHSLHANRFVQRPGVLQSRILRQRGLHRHRNEGKSPGDPHFWESTSFIRHFVA